MLIESDTVVTFHYRLSEPGGQVLEDSHGGSAVVYLHGHQGVLPGLEEALAGRRAGEQFTVTLTPEQAYGPRRENAQQRLSVKHLIHRGGRRLQPGMIVQVNTGHGPRDVVVVKAGLKTVDIDTNHPLAGRTLVFDVDVIDVRAATADELAHGHAHGEGGHQH